MVMTSLGMTLSSSLRFTSMRRPLTSRRYDNLWAKVLYWPTILLTLVVITVLTLL